MGDFFRQTPYRVGFLPLDYGDFRPIGFLALPHQVNP